MESLSLRIATQNIQWGGDPVPGVNEQPRLASLTQNLVELNADVIVLTEYKSGERGQELQMLLRESGYRHFFHQSPPTRYSLGTAIASRIPVEPIQSPITPTFDPWRSTAIVANGIKIFGFYFPLKGMPEYWNWVLANARELVSDGALLVGDFNTGKHFIDEEADTFSCSDKHVELEKIGFIDTWRVTHPVDRGATWYSSTNRGFRLDYIWASPSLAKRVEIVDHSHEARLAGMTDHSTVFADIHLV